LPPQRFDKPRTTNPSTHRHFSPTTGRNTRANACSRPTSFTNRISAADKSIPAGTKSNPGTFVFTVADSTPDCASNNKS